MGVVPKGGTRLGNDTHLATYTHGSSPVLLHLRRAVTTYAAPASPSRGGGIVFITVYVIGWCTFGAVIAMTYTYDAVADVSPGRIHRRANVYDDGCDRYRARVDLLLDVDGEIRSVIEVKLLLRIEADVPWMCHGSASAT